MSSIQLSVPSKTFLLGEYAALQSGAGLMLTTSPRFQLIAKPATSIHIAGIDGHSPAGRLMHAAPQGQAKEYNDLRFIDPYHGLGGFGASSAQFLLVWALLHEVQSKKLGVKELLAHYQQWAWDGHGIPPSGLDVVAQLLGGLCYFDKQTQYKKIFAWPFPELSYALIHTGTKLPTYLHLKELNLADTSDLQKVVQLGVRACEQQDAEAFIDAIRRYALLLAERQLVAETTQCILQALSCYDVVLASKGCGAMGADVIFILYASAREQELMTLIRDKKLNLITKGHEVGAGLDISKNETL